METEYLFKFSVQGNHRLKCYDPNNQHDCEGFYTVVPVDKTVIAVNEDHAMRNATLEMQQWYDEQGWDYEMIFWVVPPTVTKLEQIEVKKKEEKPQLSLFDL